MLLFWMGNYAVLGLACMVVGLLLALGIDQRWGEPPVAVHPVVWMGNYLKVCGRVTVRCPPALAFALGALAWSVGVLVIGLLAWVVQAWVVMQLVQALQAGPARRPGRGRDGRLRAHLGRGP